MNTTTREQLRLRNLNHLLPLWALLTTASVSHAANAAGVAQPTMSKILLSLRQDLGDMLLIREGNAMRLTPFARELLPKVQLALDSINHVYSRTETFDLQNVESTIKVGANDYVISTLGIPWLHRLRTKAPGINVDFRPIGLIYPEQLLSSDSLDIALGPKLPNMNLREQFLFSDPFVCVAAGDNLTTPDQLDLEGFAAHKHIDISPTGTGLTRIWLEKSQKALKGRRTVSHSLSLYLTLPDVICGTLDLAIVPHKFLSIAPAGSLRVIKLTFNLPRYEVSAWWHNRMHNDLLLQWAKSELVELARQTYASPCAKRPKAPSPPAAP